MIYLKCYKLANILDDLARINIPMYHKFGLAEPQEVTPKDGFCIPHS